MSNRSFGLIVAAMAVPVMAALMSVHVVAQGGRARVAPIDPNFQAPHTPWGDPDLRGAWGQRNNITTYSLQAGKDDREEHTRIGGQAPAMGKPIVDPPDGKVPYQPWAAAHAQFLWEQHRHPTKPEWLDPVARGFLEGVPRINLQGGFEIQQYPGYVVFVFDYGHTYRVVPVDGRPHPAVRLKTWMGDSRGHWDGNTLVIDVTNLNDQSWMDIVGTFHSDALRLTERWSFVGTDRIDYEVTIVDPAVYTKPWKMAWNMGRNPLDEHWENAVWEGNRLGGLGPEFWGGAKAHDYK